MDTGPISYMVTMDYADRQEMGQGEREFLWDVLKKLDGIYLSELAKRRKPPPSPTPPRRR